MTMHVCVRVQLCVYVCVCVHRLGYTKLVELCTSTADD